jgi:hypothetical protein
MAFGDINKHLNQGGARASKFEDVGESHTGVLIDAELQVMTDPKTKEIKYRKDGVTPQEQIVVTWQTEERDSEIEGDDGTRKLYMSWRMERAIKDAYRAAGAPGLEEGATLTVKYVGDEKVQGPVGKVNAKTYIAEYASPTKVIGKSASAPIAEEEEWFPSKANVTLALTLWDGGKGADVALISQATGIPVEYLNEKVLV